MRHWPVSQEEAYKAALLSGRYLANHVRPDGSFDYYYDLHADNLSSGHYNMIRHAGAVYSLFRVYKRDPDNFLFSKGKTALDFLVHYIEPCQGSLVGGLCLNKNGEAGIGGTGLALLALATFQGATGDQTYLQTMQKIASWIVEQQAQDGNYQEYNVNVSTGNFTRHTNTYGFGEALLGLGRLYLLDGQKKWLDSVLKGIHFKEAADKEHRDDEIALSSHWMVPAVRLAYGVKPQASFLKYVMRYVNGLDELQRIAPFCWSAKELSANPRCSRANSVACKTDGLANSFALLRHNSQQTVFIQQLMESHIHLLMRDHVDGQLAKKFPNPSLSQGAILDCPDCTSPVRIDDVQHTITGLLAYAEAVD